jgi:hypothetical protein
LASLRALADVRQRLPLEGWSNTEALGDKRFERGAERGQKIGFSCLYEHAERSADSQSALLRDRSAGTFIDQQQVGVQRLGDENGRRFARIQSEVHRRGIVDDPNPMRVPETLDAGCGRPSLDRLVPDGSRYHDVAKERRKDVEKVDAREIDKRRAVGDDEHEDRSARGLLNGRELALEVLDVVVDCLEAVSTGLDEEPVKRHVERPGGCGAGQAAGSHLIDHE